MKTLHHDLLLLGAVVFGGALTLSLRLPAWTMMVMSPLVLMILLGAASIFHLLLDKLCKENATLLPRQEDVILLLCATLFVSASLVTIYYALNRLWLSALASIMMCVTAAGGVALYSAWLHRRPVVPARVKSED